MKVANQAYEKMDPEQKRKFLNDLGIGTGLTSLPASLPAIALQLAIKGTGFFAYRMAVIIANAVSKFILGHGLRFATNAALTRGVSVFAGPIGWVITGIWTMVDLAGPAYRVTIPCVAHVAMLRQKSKLTACPACNAPYVGEVNFCPNCGAPL
jgi:uncharacterized protein YaaW (UPF0174 family)